MKNLQNLHTHSTYCDGRDTLTEMIETAIEKGFSSLGFSGHSYNSFSKYGMSPENTEKYKKEIADLKQKYEGRIDLFFGLEAEMLSDSDFTGYEYVIGSTHYLKIGDEIVGFDRTAEEMLAIIDKYFDGSGLAFAKCYYEHLATLHNYGKFDIIGHFDLICKHNETRHYIDESSKEYREYAFSAIEALRGKIPFFEVNTGCIPRGYRQAPYPAPFILKELKRQGFGAVISSDCHDRRYLDYGFSDAERLLLECGFTEKYILTKDGFKAVGLGE